MQVFGKDSILHLGGVETADSREAWAADTNMEVRPSLFDLNMATLNQRHASSEAQHRWTCVNHLSCQSYVTTYKPLPISTSKSTFLG